MADTDDVPLVSIHGEVERSADVKVEKVSVDGGSIAKLGAVASLGGLLFGFDTGVIAGAMPSIEKEFHLETQRAIYSLIISITLIGAMGGAAVAGPSSDKFGRRKTLGAGAVIFIVGGLLLASWPEFLLYAFRSVTGILIGRFVVGVGVGMASQVTPIYLSEVTPASRRGGVVTLFQLCITVGILTAAVIAFAFGDDWRGMFGVSVIPAAALLCAVVFALPESPRWLVAKSHIEKAGLVLQRLGYSKTNADAEIDQIQQNIVATSRQAGIRALLKPSVLRIVMIGVGIECFAQTQGINTIIYFAPKILQQSGQSQSNAKLGLILINLLNVCSTVFSVYAMDKLNRRSWLYLGSSGMVVALACLSISFSSNAPIQWLSLFSLGLYVLFFAFSWGPMSWLLPAEIMPMNVRGLATGCTAFSNWIFNFIVSQTFLDIVNGFGAPAAFGLYACIGVVACVFVKVYVPESRGRSLEEIERSLSSRQEAYHQELE